MFATPLVAGQFIVSPDASLLVYDETDASKQNHVLKAMSLDGANTVTLANISGGRLYPIVWSPNSQWVAFNHYNGLVEGTVYAAKRDGSVLFPVYKGSTIGRLLFSPNGKYLLVEETTSSTGGHLFTINLATLEAKMLQAPGLSTDYDWYAPSWKP
jgi:Tol biopolymer transport system component